jgi:Rrf2 family iron-sulfur cluster assembly transcriptional regulator
MGQTSVADIIQAVDEALDATQCAGRGDCHDEHPCMTHNLWTSLNQKMFDYLRSVTLQELVDQQKNNAECIAALQEEAPVRRPVRRIPVALSA